jgi:gliding motility-associated-like protein
MRQPLPCLLVLFVLAASTQDVSATHVRAGEITAKRISSTSLTYEITFTAYFDVETGRPAADATREAYFYINGVGPITVPRKTPVPNIGNGTTQNEYIFTYTFPAPGNFTISTSIEYRNFGIKNLPPPSSEIDFFIRSTLVINAGLGLNRTPVLLNPPIDLAAVGQRYVHNPGAFDADGDSLAYRLVEPQKSTSRGSGKGQNINGYVHPNLVPPTGTIENGTTPSTFTLDPVTGDLVWDAPGSPGFYNAAFVVEEWRNGVLIGEIVRDMQIIVIDSPNDRPRLADISDVCVEAGTLVQQTITATDRNGDALTLTSSSGVYLPDLVPAQNAQFSIVGQNNSGQTSGLFRWQTGCNHIRLEPYDVLVKVEDAPLPGFPNPALFRKLVDIRTFKIRVYGPKPQNLRAEPVADATGRAFRLTWANYPCQVPGAQIAVYRKIGCSDFEAGACQPGLPMGLGYQEIARVGVDETFYVDSDAGQGLQQGVNYSYRLVVLFPRPGTTPDEPGRLNGGGSSLPSAEFCTDFPSAGPLITHVTVDSTSQSRGVITVRWTRPAGAATGLSAQYRLLRATGLNGTNFTQVVTINTTFQATVADTLFVDRGLDTEQEAYRYKIDYYIDTNGTLAKLDESPPASSVRLAQLGGTTSQVRLTWTANVPWKNTDRIHRIYREEKGRPGVFNRIADVPVQDVQSFIFIDDGTDRYVADGTTSLTLSPDSTYCYKVETVGAYESSRLRSLTLYNFSQIICASPADTSRPCAPFLALDLLDCTKLAPDAFCNQSTFTNALSWTLETSNNQSCNANAVAYKVYYARYEDDKPAFLASVTAPVPPATAFAHTGLSSFAGCYYVTALNRFGQESAPSNLVCKDNCPQYALPNVFTPNNDGRNDNFTPLNCPEFLEQTEFTVFNRWGTKVFETKELEINWDGRSSSGRELPAGQYFYEAKVRFQSVRRDAESLGFKGWVQLLR